MSRHIAPTLALLFFITACALLITEPWLGLAPGVGIKWAIAALALSNAAILWGYFGVQPPIRKRRTHSRRRAA
jgi:hypothetical protein